MDFQPELEIKGKKYLHVDTQRKALSAIYKSDSSYLRIGIPQKIRKDLELHKKMESYGFPVPKILDEGTSDGLLFFVEDSLGDEHFGYLFQNDVKEFGKIQVKTFDQFMRVCLELGEAQLKTAVDIKNWEYFEKGIHLEDICKELPHDAERIRERYKRVKENLSAFPFVLNHGDLTPFNMYPKGVIDFEDSFLGPAGYDLGALIEHLNWFPHESEDYEYYRLYNFTPEQRRNFISEIDNLYLKNGLPKPSDYLADFDFAKGIWFVVHLEHLPKLQKFRYSLMKELLDVSFK